MRIARSFSLALASASFTLILALPNTAVKSVKPRRTTSLLIDSPAFPRLPSTNEAIAAAANAGLNLDNIQGDILVGMRKRAQLFFFFSILDPVAFKKALKSDIHPLITTTSQLLSVSTQPITAVNIAFSKLGLDTLGITEDTGDFPFNSGQASQANALGDPGTTNWVSGYTSGKIHGVFLLASDTVNNINDQLVDIQKILGHSISEVHRLQGQARPGNQEGHEHFGFMDGISQPAINGFTTNPFPGQTLHDPGRFITGQLGDSRDRPAWAVDGSFLAFRQLKQLVPEFNKFLKDNALNAPGLSAAENAELLGARMIGRWKSGAPIDLAPLKDDPSLAADPQRNNNFDFNHPNKDISTNQNECPFSAHIRKTRPRGDFNPANTENQIIRASIPYGPEVTNAENAAGKSDDSLERGLAFVAYQSDIEFGFSFIQQSWVDNDHFPFLKNDTTPGWDPIIGSNGGQSRFTSGLDPLDATHDFNLPFDFVVSRGGEYFFSPSLEAISGTLSS